jgi:hypothetical protein
VLRTWLSGRLFKDSRLALTYSTSPGLSLAMFPMSAALPTSSSPQEDPPASLPPEIPHDSGLDPTPTVIVPSDVVIDETGLDEPTTSLRPFPFPHSSEQVPRLVDPPGGVELHEHRAPVHISIPARPHSVTGSHIKRDHPLPAIPANATLAPRGEVLLRPRVTSDPGYEHARRRSHHLRRPEPPPVQPLHLPGSGVYRQRSATIPGEIEFEDVTPARVRSPFQVCPLRPHCRPLWLPRGFGLERLPSRVRGRPARSHVERGAKSAERCSMAGYARRHDAATCICSHPSSAQLNGRHIP